MDDKSGSTRRIRVGRVTPCAPSIATIQPVGGAHGVTRTTFGLAYLMVLAVAGAKSPQRLRLAGVRRRAGLHDRSGTEDTHSAFKAARGQDIAVPRQSTGDKTNGCSERSSLAQRRQMPQPDLTHDVTSDQILAVRREHQ